MLLRSRLSAKKLGDYSINISDRNNLRNYKNKTQIIN